MSSIEAPEASIRLLLPSAELIKKVWMINFTDQIGYQKNCSMFASHLRKKEGRIKDEKVFFWLQAAQPISHCVSWLVGQLVCRSVPLFTSRHYCPCPTACDRVVVYTALFFVVSGVHIKGLCCL